MSDTKYVKGLSELQKFLDTLPDKLQRNVMRGSLRAGMKIGVLPRAYGNIHNVSGQLANGLRVGSRVRGTVVTATVKTKGPHSYVGRWLEYGTKAHMIIAKKGGSLVLGGLFRGTVYHPGFSKRPFLRPALDAGAQIAVVEAAKYMKARLATKHGLDTAYVMIEGDEE